MAMIRENITAIIKAGKPPKETVELVVGFLSCRRDLIPDN